MGLKIDGKKAIVAELLGALPGATSAVVADYRGMKVSEMTELRANARKKGVYMRIFRNTLARRGLADTEFACLADTLVGPIALFFSYDEPGAAAKLIQTFIKNHENLEVRALAMGGQLLEADKLKQVASLPSRDEALALLMSTMQVPVTQFVRTLHESYARIVRVMAAVRDKKQQA